MSNLAGNLTNLVAIWINIKLKYKVVIFFSWPVPYGENCHFSHVSHTCVKICLFEEISSHAVFPALFIYENMWENAWEKNCFVRVYNYVGVIILVVNCFTHMLFATLSVLDTQVTLHSALGEGLDSKTFSLKFLSLIILDTSYNLFVYLFHCVKFLSNLYLIGQVLFIF